MMIWMLRECGGSVAKATTVTLLGLYWIIGALLLMLAVLFPAAATGLSHAFAFPAMFNALWWWVLIPGSWVIWYFNYRSVARSVQHATEAREALEALERYSGHHQTTGETL